jgi:hypothetical protein
MVDWLIHVPAWGQRCVPLFINVVLPAIRPAMFRASGRVRFMVHTDNPIPISEALGDCEHEIRTLPALQPRQNAHHRMGMCNREAMAAAHLGEAVAFINADMVPSIEVFSAAEKAFKHGRRLVMMAATRTVGAHAPPGLKSRELLLWTMQYRHPSIVDNFYGSGRSSVPWAIYFFDGRNVILHAFHLHPFAYLKEREIAFNSATIDGDFVSNFSREQVHIVRRPDEAAFAEISPLERWFPSLPAPYDTNYIAKWAHTHASEMHCWFFTQPITIVGKARDLGGTVCAEVMRKIENCGGPLEVYQ